MDDELQDNITAEKWHNQQQTDTLRGNTWVSDLKSDKHPRAKIDTDQIH